MHRYLSDLQLYCATAILRESVTTEWRQNPVCLTSRFISRLTPSTKLHKLSNNKCENTWLTAWLYKLIRHVASLWPLHDFEWLLWSLSQSFSSRRSISHCTSTAFPIWTWKWFRPTWHQSLVWVALSMLTKFLPEYHVFTITGTNKYSCFKDIGWWVEPGDRGVISLLLPRYSITVSLFE